MPFEIVRGLVVKNYLLILRADVVLELKTCRLLMELSGFLITHELRASASYQSQNPAENF